RIGIRMGLLGAVIVGTIAGLAAARDPNSDSPHFPSTAERGAVAGLVLGLSFLLGVLRVFYHAAHPFFLWPRPLGESYPWHPVAWADFCSVEFPGLDRLLVAFADERPAAAEAEIERLVTRYESQKLQALQARAILLTRETGRIKDLAALDPIVAR